MTAKSIYRVTIKTGDKISWLEFYEYQPPNIKKIKNEYRLYDELKPFPFDEKNIISIKKRKS